MSDHKQLDYLREGLEFYPHQIEGVRELAKMNSFLLADEMGLGKSLQSLAVAAIDVQMGWAKRILVVCPASLKGNWYDEVNEHTKFTAMVLGVDDPNDPAPKSLSPSKRRAQLEEFRDTDCHILIVNYEQVLGHLDELNDLGFDIVLYDEAHYIKNPKAKRTKAIHKLHGKRHFLLTGSPMLGHVNDLWSLLYRINPDMESYWRFCNRYCVYGGYKDKQIVGVKNREELQARLQSYMVRRLKKDVLDLPDKQFIQIKVGLGPLQKKLYDQVVDELRLAAPDPTVATGMEIENALAKFTRLKQICGTPAAINFEDGESYPDESPKLDRMEEMAEEITKEQGEHVVVFTQSRGVHEAICSRLRKRGIPVFMLTGDVPIPQRQQVVSNWSEHDEPAAMVAMLQVAGVGLNMTAASKALIVDKLFVPSLMNQAHDRLHRIGASTTQPVQIYEFITRGTIESRVEQILRTKKQLFDDVVETSDWKRALYAAIMEEDDE